MARKRKFIVPNVKFTGIADKGKSVGRDEDGRVLFVEKVAPGDVADVLVLRKKKSYWEGVPKQFHKLSKDRVTPFCEHFGVCGGCKWQHITYESQVRHKQQVVQDALVRIGKIDIEEMLPLIPAPETTYYRNKLEFTFSNKRWLTEDEINTDISNQEDVLGFHRPGAYDKIVDIKHCYLQADPSNEIRLKLKQIGKDLGYDFFDLRNKSGFLRHIMIRLTSIGEILVIVSFYENDQTKIKTYFEEALRQLPQITTLVYCINSKVNDFVLDLDMHTYYGKGYIEEKLRDVRFKIGPKSFFQTNTKQAEALYDVIVKFAGLTGTENVYDLYTGVGSIALYVAKYCRQVVGIEEVEDAIRDAIENAALNEIHNTVFYAGDVKNILSADFAKRHGKPDVLITDPPRAGMHTKVVEMLLELAAPKIVYVSCNPSTQARDLNLLKEKYEVLKVQAVDMFPHTHHVESVALLALKTEV